MKKRIAVLLALMIGFTYCPSEHVVMAAGSEEKAVETVEKEADSSEQNEEQSVDEKDTSKSEDKKADDEEEGSFFNNLLGNLFDGNDIKEKAENERREKTQEPENKKSTAPKPSGLKNLQIPQKISVVLDPWETDKKGQVYSEEYIISNTGEAPGLLTLSGLACRPREQSGVIVRTDTLGIHDSGDKAIYMEMLLGSGERIVFSKESNQYQRELQPGEELSIRFAGEVNENAFGQWEDNDVSVSVIYSWKTEEELSAMSLEVSDEEGQADFKKNTEDIEGKAQDHTESIEKTDSDLNSEELIEQPEEGTEKETSEEQKSEENGKETAKELTEEPPFETDSLQESSVDNIGDGKFESEAGKQAGVEAVGVNPSPIMNITSNISNISNEVEKEEDEIKKIDLHEQQKVDVDIEDWKIDGNGQIVSPQYLLENTGETTGIWMLSELVCRPRDQGNVLIKTDKNELQSSEEKSVYMELVAGNGERIVLSREKLHYQVELKPGETLYVRFVGETNCNLFETSKDGDIVVNAVCTWNLK